MGEGVFFLLFLGVAPGILEVRLLNGRAHRGDMAPCCAWHGIQRWEEGCGVELGSPCEDLLPVGSTREGAWCEAVKKQAATGFPGTVAWCCSCLSWLLTLPPASSSHLGCPARMAELCLTWKENQLKPSGGVSLLRGHMVCSQ